MNDSVWNDAWECPKCHTQFTRENLIEWSKENPDGFEGEYDFANPLHNPLGCGDCNTQCKPIGRNFTYDDEYRVRTYLDNRQIFVEYS